MAADAKKFYITTPLYYVNASPHIGHAYTTIAADALARYMRGVYGEKNVWLLTGTDEHGQKIQKASEAAGIDPQRFADDVSGRFKQLWGEFDISYNDFIRTTEERHKRFVRTVLQIVYDKGDIYEAEYSGYYCQPCESFWTEKQAQDGLCPDCKRPVEKISEKNYFFRLSKYQGWLIDYIEQHPDFIYPDFRRNEVMSFLRLNQLTDLCISRPKERLSWGIGLPFSADHVTYVWFDALINYISAVGDFDEKGVYRSQWWPADCQLMAKDILRQHAIYWPIMLKALDIPPPRMVAVHGWWLMDDAKMSKSLGNVVSPRDIVAKYGLDVFRYFLLRDMPFGLDGNFSEQAIIKRYNSDLANDLGNLVYRTLTMVEKYYGGMVPEKSAGEGEQAEAAIRSKMASLSLADAFRNKCDFGLALDRIWELINLANKYVEETKPWNLAKEKKEEELKRFIRLLVEVIRVSAEALSPFLPHTSGAIREQIGSQRIAKGQPLFPRIDTKKPGG